MSGTALNLNAAWVLNPAQFLIFRLVNGVKTKQTVVPAYIMAIIENQISLSPFKWALICLWISVQ